MNNLGKPVREFTRITTPFTTSTPSSTLREQAFHSVLTQTSAWARQTMYHLLQEQQVPAVNRLPILIENDLLERSE